MPTNTAKREYRTCIELRAAADAGACIVEGYAATFNQPYTLYKDGDYELREQIGPDAFALCDMADVIMQYDHSGRVFARTRNGTLTLSTDEHGLKIRADLSGTENGRRLYEEIKGGFVDRMSFAFTVGAEKREEAFDGDRTVITRTITAIRKLYDVSAVSIPANDATEISARAYSDGVIAEAEAERLRALDFARKKLEFRLRMEEIK